MKIQKLIQSRFAKLRVLIALLLLAGVGSYLVFSSEAADTDYSYPYNGNVSDYPNMIRLAPLDGLPYNALLGYNDDKTPLPPGTLVNGQMHVRMDSPSAPPSEVYIMISYDTDRIKFNTSRCVWKYGCTVKDNYDLQTAATAARASWMGGEGYDMCDRDACWHKKKIAFCFTVPARQSRFKETLAATYQFQRTNHPGVKQKDHGMVLYALGYRLGSRCQDNPDLKDVWWWYGMGMCDHPSSLLGTAVPVDWACDAAGNGPGAGNGTFFGFGNGGTGNGTNGQGEGSGPGPGASGGGGGSSANRQADKPNSLPSPSPQGENKQTELDPDPFFDGKDFEKGSDSDNLVFGNSTIGGKKVPKILLYILSATLLGGAGGALYWRWKKQKA